METITNWMAQNNTNPSPCSSPSKAAAGPCAPRGLFGRKLACLVLAHGGSWRCAAFLGLSPHHPRSGLCAHVAVFLCAVLSPSIRRALVPGFRLCPGSLSTPVSKQRSGQGFGQALSSHDGRPQGEGPISGPRVQALCSAEAGAAAELRELQLGRRCVQAILGE